VRDVMKNVRIYSKTIDEQLYDMFMENVIKDYPFIKTIVWSQQYCPEDFLGVFETTVDYRNFMVNDIWLDYFMSRNVRSYNSYFTYSDKLISGITTYDEYRTIFDRIRFVLMSFSINELMFNFGKQYVKIYI
jgi:hypothetical protein